MVAISTADSELVGWAEPAVVVLGRISRRVALALACRSARAAVGAVAGPLAAPGCLSWGRPAGRGAGELGCARMGPESMAQSVMRATQRNSTVRPSCQSEAHEGVKAFPGEVGLVESEVGKWHAERPASRTPPP